MKKDEIAKVENKKKLVLRRERIRVVDSVDLSLVTGGRASEDEPIPWDTDSRPPEVYGG